MGSNNWVIHGNYTKTGKPLLASDPHISTSLPSSSHLVSLHFNANYLSGV